MSITQLRDNLESKIRKVSTENFEKLALSVFRYQAAYNPLYQEYLHLLRTPIDTIKRLEEIPFLPISLFKQTLLQTGRWSPLVIFTSSGTTGDTTSRHPLRAHEWYQFIAEKGFQHFYGPPKNYAILALLPSYLERTGSSLVYMVDHFIKQSVYPESGFFLDDLEKLTNRLHICREKNIPTLLIGVSFALLDLAETFQIDLAGGIVMETGGMKGRRKEITREELHSVLKKAFNLETVHSEYGMTELLSQAYSQGEGRFFCAPTMHTLIREVTDPFAYQPDGRSGAINIIDLANLDTISFIATDDLGKRHSDGSFEILGRLDASDIRGCNLMVE